MAPEIVRQLGRHSYYFEGCCGSAAVLFAKEPSEHEVVCDLHGALTNLAWCVQDEVKSAELFHRLQCALYHDDIYKDSKEQLELLEGSMLALPQKASVAWAYHYFIASWMGRNGVAGTASVNYQIATRWTKGGGSGPLRFRNAVDSIPAWCDRLRNVHILRRDMFEVLDKIEDDKGVAIYIAPPYRPGTLAGNSKYVHDFTGDAHQRLAVSLTRFKKARVVCSYYDSPELDKLYPPPKWTKLDCSRQKHLSVQNKRGMDRNSTAPEVLLVNGEPVSGPPILEPVVGNATLFG